jgi:hypothetical protein
MSANTTEFDRREFLKIVFGTLAATAVSGSAHASPILDDIPVSEPYRLELEGEYFFDPLHDWGQIVLPTWREKLAENYAFSTLTVDQQDGVICEALGVENFAEHPSFDRGDWLGSQIDIENLSLREAAMIGPYWPGIEIFEFLGWDEASRLGVEIIEGDHPGSTFMAAQFVGDVKVLNGEIANLGMNLVVL